MITGFNTDVEHEGIIYHVQTEDKGLDTPLMLTLVYTRGEILASKRVRYDDLIASGFDETVLAERLLRQHKLICAAIRAGRLEDLKQMSERDNTSRTQSKIVPPSIKVPPIDERIPPASPVVVPVVEPVIAKPVQPTRTDHRLPPPPQRLPSRVVQPPAPVVAPISAMTTPVETPTLRLVILDEKNYRGGDRVFLRVRVEEGGDQRQLIPNAEVIVKILGSTFRPLIYQTQTTGEGIASFRTEIPHFRSGRAAILVRATVGGIDAELRRIIQQG